MIYLNLNLLALSPPLEKCSCMLYLAFVKVPLKYSLSDFRADALKFEYLRLVLLLFYDGQQYFLMHLIKVSFEKYHSCLVEVQNPDKTLLN